MSMQSAVRNWAIPPLTPPGGGGGVPCGGINVICPSPCPIGEICRFSGGEEMDLETLSQSVLAVAPGLDAVRERGDAADDCGPPRRPVLFIPRPPYQPPTPAGLHGVYSHL